jgi:hypothetical protein
MAACVDGYSEWEMKVKLEKLFGASAAPSDEAQANQQHFNMVDGYEVTDEVQAEGMKADDGDGCSGDRKSMTPSSPR